MFWADRVQDHRTRSLRLRIPHWCLVVTQSQNAWTVFPRFRTLSSPSCCCSLHSPWCKFKRCTTCSCIWVYIAYIFSLFCVLCSKKEFRNSDLVLQPYIVTNKKDCTLYPVLLLPCLITTHTQKRQPTKLIRWISVWLCVNYDFSLWILIDHRAIFLFVFPSCGLGSYMT